MRALKMMMLGLCVAIAGCGQKSDKTTTITGSNGSMTVTGNGSHMVIKSDNGKSTVEYSAGGDVHADMPDFAPLYPGAKVTSSMNGTGNGGNSGAMVTMTVSAPAADVITFYKQKATAAGFTEKMTMNEGNAQMYIAAKDKKSLQVTATSGGDGTQVQIVWANGQ
jgi:hypothetical protein